MVITKDKIDIKESVFFATNEAVIQSRSFNMLDQLARVIQRHPEITRVALYLDNDLAGRVNARKIKALLKSDQRFSKIRVSVNPPRSGKDYNEKLQRTLQAIREEKHASRQKQAAVSI